jgi:hypothetical protein
VSIFSDIIMSKANQSIAFFGATGGVTGAALAEALRDGYACVARKMRRSGVLLLITDKFSCSHSGEALQNAQRQILNP